jgi:hypothetical protein
MTIKFPNLSRWKELHVHQSPDHGSKNSSRNIMVLKKRSNIDKFRMLMVVGLTCGNPVYSLKIAYENMLNTKSHLKPNKLVDN